jgi:hypothetical protein
MSVDGRIVAYVYNRVQESGEERRLARDGALAQPARDVRPPRALVPVLPTIRARALRAGMESGGGAARAADGVDAREQRAREEARARVGRGVVPRVERARGVCDPG